MLSEVALRPSNLPACSHVVTVKQINIGWPPSFLLSFAKVVILDIIHHKKKKKNQGEVDLFFKTKETALKKKKDVRKSAQMMIHSHISQYLVKNSDNFWSLCISRTSSMHQFILFPLCLYASCIILLAVSYSSESLPFKQASKEKQELHSEKVQISIKISGIQDPMR